jgi:hypothetical protein
MFTPWRSEMATAAPSTTQTGADFLRAANKNGDVPKSPFKNRQPLPPVGNKQTT